MTTRPVRTGSEVGWHPQLNASSLQSQMRTIDPDAIYEKALSHPDGTASLDELELPIYAVKEFETYVSMSGWTSFFVSACSYLYDDLRRGLERAGDARSLAILDEFEKCVTSDGFQ